MVNKRFTLLNENVENKKSPICENNNLLNYSTVCNLLNELYEEKWITEIQWNHRFITAQKYYAREEIERLTEMYFQNKMISVKWLSRIRI